MAIYVGRPGTIAAVIVWAWSILLPQGAWSSGLPQKDSALPVFTLQAPPLEEDQKYLGIQGPTFQPRDVECQLLLIEILGVYCPLCYQQAPLFNKLLARISRKSLTDKVKMLGIAVGATSMELEYLRKKGSYEYPVVQDESSAVHKLLGEPRTPFTLIVDRGGTVRYTHLGVIEDMDTFFQQIQDLLQ